MPNTTENLPLEWDDRGTIKSAIVKFDALPHVQTVADFYPRGWPKCRCGLPVLDGHSTCGRSECR